LLLSVRTLSAPPRAYVAMRRPSKTSGHSPRLAPAAEVAAALAATFEATSAALRPAGAGGLNRSAVFGLCCATPTRYGDLLRNRNASAILR
jgi:hypothetical protein